MTLSLDSSENPYDAPGCAQESVPLEAFAAISPELHALPQDRLERLYRTSWIFILLAPFFLLTILPAFYLSFVVCLSLLLPIEAIEGVLAMILGVFTASWALVAAHAISIRPQDGQVRVKPLLAIWFLLGGWIVASMLFQAWATPWLLKDAWAIGILLVGIGLMLCAVYVHSLLREVDQLFGTGRFLHEELREESLRRAALVDEYEFAEAVESLIMVKNDSRER